VPALLALSAGCASTPATSADGTMLRVPAGEVDLGPPPPPGMKTLPPPPPNPPPALAWESHPTRPLATRAVAVDAFWIDRTEVTRAAYRTFLQATGYRPPHVDEPWARDGWNWVDGEPPPGTDDHPVVLVSWYDAAAYCAWAGKRLPGEAEWQRAALGDRDSARAYPWGDAYDATRLNHGTRAEPFFDPSDGYRTTSPVDSFPNGASPVGALDMFGNAWEFTADARIDGWNLARGDRTGERVLRDYSAPMPALYVAVRGGSYYFDLETNVGAERHAFLPELRRKTSGFRCAKDDE
jgi:serine/threonine-protein kinase